MPELYDYHEHHNHYITTHSHDDHPRHYHDRNGSVLYLNPSAVVVYRATKHHDGPIGCGGFDVKHS